jgi:hypothetical protein
MTFTQSAIQSVVGVSVLALAIGASPASAQSRERERAPQRHGSYRQAQPPRQVSRDVRVRSVRGPERVSQRTVVRTSRGPDGFRGGSYGRRDYVRTSYVRSYSPSRYVSRGHGGSYAVPRHYEQRRRGGRVYVSSGRYYRPYYRPYYRSYYPRSRFYLGYGYGWGYPYSFIGYPYMYPGFGYGYGYGYGNPYGPYGYPYYGSGYAEDQGGIRLQMNPKQAEVFADGYYVGTVDDFDGISQRLALEAGHHKLEIRAEGFEPFELDVNILRAQTIKYKGVLRPLP